MPGGVAGERPVKAVPYADLQPGLTCRQLPFCPDWAPGG